MQLLSYFQLFWGGGDRDGNGGGGKNVGWWDTKVFLKQKNYGIFSKQQKHSIVEQLSFN